MTTQPGDYYVTEAVSWINSVEGLSDDDREDGREVIAVLLAHHDELLHQGRVPLDECLRLARRELAPEDADSMRLAASERHEEAGPLSATTHEAIVAPTRSQATVPRGEG